MNNVGITNINEIGLGMKSSVEMDDTPSSVHQSKNNITVRSDCVHSPPRAKRANMVRHHMDGCGMVRRESDRVPVQQKRLEFGLIHPSDDHYPFFFPALRVCTYPILVFAKHCSTVSLIDMKYHNQYRQSVSSILERQSNNESHVRTLPLDCCDPQHCVELYSRTQ